MSILETRERDTDPRNIVTCSEIYAFPITVNRQTDT